MSRQRKWILRIGGGAAVLLAGGLLAALWARHDSLRAEYPDAPFAPFPDDSPFLHCLDEAPSPKDAAASARYQKWAQSYSRFIREKGYFGAATAEERAVLVSVTQDQLLRARELALAVLQKHPDSIPARYAITVVEEQAEGNYPRALLQTRSLRRLLYRRGLQNPRDEVAREWFLLVLFRELRILNGLYRCEEELRVIEVVEQICRPWPQRRLVTLIKLRRFDEARRAFQQAETIGQGRAELMLDHMRLAGQEGRRKEYYDLGLQAVAAQPGSCALRKEFAAAAADDFRFQEACDAAVKAAGLPLDYYGSPYQLLCNSYIDQGRIAEAWDALKKFQEQRRYRGSYTLQFDQDELDATAARMFLALGRCENAVYFARRRVEKPHRMALRIDPRDDAFSGDLLLLDALRNRLEQLREQAAGGNAGQGATSESAALRLECWALEKRVVRTLGDEDYLLKCLRPPKMHHVLPLLPGGVAAEALRRARQKEQHPAAAPYFDALEAELAWNQGRYQQTLTPARKALAGLSADFEKNLRARVAVVAGDAAGKLGQHEEMLSLFDQALRDCPAAFRTCCVAIPIHLADDGSPLAQALGERILASPRFREDAAGFSVALRTTGRQLTFELSRLQNTRHCADAVAVEGRPAEVVAAAYRRFHQRLMSPLLDLKPIDVNFLEDCLFAAPPGERIDATIGLLKPR